ncbi:MAG: hypothetical protein K0R09_1389, partial [Clostridiales bacterium]|nr:hypothetical protein [Clostridiales bacterium]
MKVYAATPHVTTTQDKKKQPLAAFRLLINPMIFLIKIMGFNIGFKNNALALSYEYA